MNLDQVRQFIMETSESSKVYIGSDSVRYKEGDTWYAEYATVIVIHYDGCRGCKVFGSLESEKDYDQKKNKPRLRLMHEVMRTAMMYINLEEAFGCRHVEIHLDINPDEHHGSSCVISEATGYIRGMCNVVPMVKPNAFAASYAADRLKEILAA